MLAVSGRQSVLLPEWNPGICATVCGEGLRAAVCGEGLGAAGPEWGSRGTPKVSRNKLKETL